MVSPNYFGDVIKKTTGDTASGHIRQVVILLAKNALSIKEIAAPHPRWAISFSQLSVFFVSHRLQPFV